MINQILWSIISWLINVCNYLIRIEFTYRIELQNTSHTNLHYNVVRKIYHLKTFPITCNANPITSTDAPIRAIRVYISLCFSSCTLYASSISDSFFMVFLLRNILPYAINIDATKLKLSPMIINEFNDTAPRHLFWSDYLS